VVRTEGEATVLVCMEGMELTAAANGEKERLAPEEVASKEALVGKWAVAASAAGPDAGVEAAAKMVALLKEEKTEKLVAAQKIEAAAVTSAAGQVEATSEVDARMAAVATEGEVLAEAAQMAVATAVKLQGTMVMAAAKTAAEATRVETAGADAATATVVPATMEAERRAVPSAVAAMLAMA